MKLTDLIRVERGAWDKDYHATCGEIEAIEKTQLAAVYACADAVQEALSGGYDPALLQHMGYTCLVWRDPRIGWTYRIFSDRETHEEISVSTLLGRSRAKTVQAARLHLAQNIWGGGTVEAALAAQVIEDGGDQADFLAYTEHYERIKAYASEHRMSFYEASQKIPLA